MTKDGPRAPEHEEPPLWWRALASLGSLLAFVTIPVCTIVVGAAALQWLSTVPPSPLRTVSVLAVLFVGTPVAYIQSKRAFERWLARKQREIRGLDAQPPELTDGAGGEATSVAVSSVVDRERTSR